MEYTIYKNKPMTSQTTKEIMDDIRNHPDKYIHTRVIHGCEFNNEKGRIKNFYIHYYYNIEDVDFIFDNKVFLAYKGMHIEGFSIIPIKSILNKKVLENVDQKMNHLVSWVEDNSYLKISNDEQNFNESKKKFKKLSPAQQLVYYASGGKYHF